MQVTVFGASGKVGQLVTAGLLEQGYAVVAFVHRQSPFPEQPGLSLLQGDVHDATAVARAVAGSDVVMSTLGSWGTPSKDIVSTATQHILAAAHTDRQLRFISVTGADAWTTREQPNLLQRVSHSALQHIAKKILQDAERQLALLTPSGIDWTVLRSPIMTNAATRAYTLTDERPMPWATVSRQAVAAALIAQITDQTWSQQAPFIRSAT